MSPAQAGAPRPGRQPTSLSSASRSSEASTRLIVLLPPVSCTSPSAGSPPSKLHSIRPMGHYPHGTKCRGPQSTLLCSHLARPDGPPDHRERGDPCELTHAGTSDRYRADSGAAMTGQEFAVNHPEGPRGRPDSCSPGRCPVWNPARINPGRMRSGSASNRAPRVTSAPETVPMPSRLARRSGRHRRRPWRSSRRSRSIS